MKRALLIVMLFLASLPCAFADHITGGEIHYTFNGIANGLYGYTITVKLYMRCSSDREFNNPAMISVFNAKTRARINDYRIPLNRTELLNLGTSDPCITNPPPVCYRVGYYVFNVSLPASADGYSITAQVVYRIDGINNLVDGYDQVGATYTSIIPSTADVANAPENNSAKFAGNDLVVICAENRFSYSFEAVDADGDELRYSFCNAYNTSGLQPGDNTTPLPPPPYLSVPYGNGFNGSEPLGKSVQINPATGLITGIAPATGTYVVTVCVEEIRNGVVIAIQRKDLQINIAPCVVAAAALPAEYMLCGSSKTLAAKNLSTSPLIKTYNWELSDRSGNILFETDNAQAVYNFADTGTYIVKLVVNSGQVCTDSTVSTVRVYPGFEPAMNISGACINNPVAFNDASTTVYGLVNKWSWDFGETALNNDTSSERNTNFLFSSTGNKTVNLVAGNNLGCLDTVSRSVNIFDKPPILLGFQDTLICPPDALELQAAGNGNFSWSPAAAMSNPLLANPVVNPTATGRYIVTLNDQGCFNSDTVDVRVVNTVSIAAMPDTVICEGDQAALHIISDGLKFNWSPALSLDDPSILNPVATPASSTTYQVVASISSCSSSANISVATVPYPQAFAGPDTLICFQTAATLHGVTDGSSFHWKSDPSLRDGASPDPVVRPLRSTEYIFSAFDTRGCPKPGIDTVLVTVLPEIIPFAGNDTAAVINQPLQLGAKGGTSYQWFPSNALSSDTLSNPVALFFSTSSPEGFNYKVLVYNEAGCVDSADLNIRVFSTGPDIFVPSAFTPNGDGRNDFFQPVSAGISRIENFRIFNRWGQQVYDAVGLHGLGWDGNVGGNPQPSGTFVWVLKAIDYTGVRFTKKGTVTLIR